MRLDWILSIQSSLIFMFILICCEESQAACIAFRKKGHVVFSCDLQRCSGGHPEWHIVGDCLSLINGNCSFVCENGDSYYVSKWDMLICHPPCTYLSCAGACNLYVNGVLNYERYYKGVLAAEFFKSLLYAPVEYICVENPRPISIFNLPPRSQYIEPYFFGDPYTKRTYLWLKGLPLLKSTNVVSPIASWTGIHYGSKLRSKSFPGIVEAMASQWSDPSTFDLQLSFDF